MGVAQPFLCSTLPVAPCSLFLLRAQFQGAAKDELLMSCGPRAPEALAYSGLHYSPQRFASAPQQQILLQRSITIAGI